MDKVYYHFFSKYNKSLVLEVIGDSKGLVMASMANRIPQQLQPVEIEALAANRALVFAREMNIKEAFLEGDSL